MHEWISKLACPKPMIIRSSGLGYSVFVYIRKVGGLISQIGEVKYHTLEPKLGIFLESKHVMR